MRKDSRHLFSPKATDRARAKLPRSRQLLLLLFLGACGTGSPQNGGPGPPSDMLAADLSPAGPGTSFQTVETDVFSARCGGFPSCHLKAPYAGNLNLSSGSAFQSLVGVAASIDASKIRVVAGNPANSFLVQKLTNQLPTGGQDGSPMPQNEGLPWTELPQNLIDEVESWISAGALNN